MSTREKFTDIHDNSFVVTASEAQEGHVYLEMLSNNPGRWIPGEDAPAVALAVLKAAGKTADDLANYEEQRNEQAEREAEDAKVQEWLDARNAAFGTIGDHWNLDDAAREGYRESKAFWEKHLGAREDVIPVEVVEPRTVESAEDLNGKHWAAKWEDTDGCVWEFSPRGWGWRSREEGKLRISDPESFPWTEVL